MQFYPIISIDLKFLKNNDTQLFNTLKKCARCNKIPLPSYHNQNLTYSWDCYGQQNFDAKKFIEPTEEHIFFLGNLLINCKFEEKGCRETFKFNSFQYLLDHEKDAITIVLEHAS